MSSRRPQVPGPSVVRTQARPSLEMDTQELRQVAARWGWEGQKRLERRLDWLLDNGILGTCTTNQYTISYLSIDWQF